jgi:flagellar hook-associated protein 1 FlgK
MGDNILVRRMADLGEQELADLGGSSPTDALLLIVTETGQKIAIRQARHDALQNVMQQLENQKDTVSGVDINEEAAKMLVFERMFQGMAKFLGVQQTAMQALIDLL